MIIGYTRVSSAKQATDGAGLEVQAEKIRAWAAYQGLADPSIHSDVLSGSHTDRPGFRAAVTAALDSHGSTLVVYKLDRLGRNALDVQETLAVLLDGGVRVVSLADGVDSASGMGKALLKLLTTLLAAFAELERETILSRHADGRARARADGRVYARIAPYGYRKTDDGRLVPDPDEQALGALIRGFAASGDSDAVIVRKLALMGATRRNGHPWDRSAVRRIARGRTPSAKAGSARVDDARKRLLSE